jgi:tol-pal system protein YbgF
MISPSAISKRSLLPVFAVVLLVGAATPSFAQEPGGLFGGLFGGSDRARGERAPSDEAPVMVQSGPDLVVRLERLENQIRQLTGSIEQLQFRNQQLEQQLRRSQEDIEYRFQELGGKATPRPRASQPAAQPPPAPPPAAEPPSRRRSDVFDPNESPDAPGVPRTLGSASSSQGAPPTIMAEEPAIGAAGGRDAGSPLDLSTLAARAARDPALNPEVAAAPPGPAAGPLPAPPPSNPNATGAPRTAMAPVNSPKEEFAVAQAFIQQKDYAQAEDAFREFIKKHPNDRMVSEANYWVGESLFQRQRYRDAAESFLAVSTKHEKSAKAPDALLRLGQSLAALGEKDASCATFAEVGRKYPKATAVKQGAEREQKRGRC